MKKLQCILTLAIVLSPVFAQKIEVDRISDRIIILNEGYFRSVAILTDKGVVLIDTREPLEKMEEIKKLVKQEFKTGSFCYIINTHGCPEHILGNVAFPETPVIMNNNFFNRKKIYNTQKQYIDSVEVVCSHITDSVEKQENCHRLEEGKNWRRYCIKALKINPDITFSEKLNLHFENLTVQLFFTGLGHGYSLFIYIPEENFIHTATIGSKWSVIKYKIPRYLDGPEFIPYQISTIKEIIGLTDSIKYVVPGHGDYYSADTLKQKLIYYTELFDHAKKLDISKMDFDAFKAECSIEKKFPYYEIFQNLREKDLESHNENITWLWEYFGKTEGK